jgi:hypothetical protein
MKRIICTVSNDLTFDQRMIRICTTLASAGYQVQLWGRELPDSKPLAQQVFAQKRLRLRSHRGKFFYLELNLRLFFQLLFSSCDIIYAVDLDTLVPGRLVAKLRGKHLVYDAHEYFSEVPELMERPITKRIWEIVARLFIPGTKYAVTVCESLAKVLADRYGVHFEVVRNVPFRREEPSSASPKPEKFTILYQGVLNDGRGLEESILAMKLLPDAELWICGEGDISTALKELTLKNRLGQQVKFFGKLPPEELSRLTQQADIGLNLLKNKGLNYYYSLANKAFDYIQAGLPSIGMKFPEYIRLHEEYGVFHLLDELSPQQVADAVNHLRSDRKYYETIAANCRVAAKSLNWQLESQKLFRIFDAMGKS